MFNSEESQMARKHAKVYEQIRQETLGEVEPKPQIKTANIDIVKLSVMLGEVISEWDIRGYADYLQSDKIYGVSISSSLAFDIETGVLYKYDSQEVQDGVTWNGDDMYYKSYKTVITNKETVGNIDIENANYDDEMLESLACQIINEFQDLGLIRNRYRQFDDLPKSNGIVDLSKLDEQHQKSYKKAVSYNLAIINNPDDYHLDCTPPACPESLKGKQTYEECTPDDLRFLERYMRLHKWNERVFSTIR